MKKFTLLILLMAFSFGYGQQPMIKTYGNDNPVHFNQQRNTQGVAKNVAVHTPLFRSIEANEQEEILADQIYQANNIIITTPVGVNRGPQADITPTAGTTETFTPSVGDNFFDPGGPGGANTNGTPGNYPNCGCDTQTTLAGVTEIEFLDFGVNGNFDYLRLYDGTDATGTVLYDNSATGANNGEKTLADMIASNGSATFTAASGNFFFFFHSSTVVNWLGWDVEIVAIGGGGPFPDPYCGPLDFTSNVEPITLVDVAGINNVTSATVNGTPDHEDFTTINGDMEAGMSYPIALEGNTDGNFTNRFVVFIDWNQNDILNDAGEVYEITDLLVNSTGVDGQQSNGTIDVPPGALPGTTRMRVKKQFGTTNYLDPCLATGFGQAEDYTIEVTSGGTGSVCSEENPNDFTFENGYNCSSASAFQTANDITVAADESFTLENITASIFANGGIANVDVNYYSNAGGLPGALIGSEASVTIDAQAVIGANFGFNVNEVEMTVTPFTFVGQAGVPTTYWIELSVTDGGSTGSVFWVVTSSSSQGNPVANFNGGWGQPDPLVDGVYIWEGTCDPIGGGCPIVSDCNLSDTTPDDATSPDIWDRPFADGTCCSGLGPVSYDVYGPFTVDVSGLYTIDSDQIGGWDGFLFLYETCFDPLDQTTNYVAGDDDGPGGIGTSQILDVNLSTGTDYYIITTGFSAGDFGDFTNTITGVGTATCGGPVLTYDDCAGAIALACGDSVVGETLTATNSGGNAAPDVFYKFTGTGTTQLVTISLCGGGTDYDSYLRVFDDCDLLNELAFNDDSCGLQSELTFTSDGTSTYYIMVEGFGSGSGNFSLDVSCMDPLPNDGCGGAIAVSCGDTVMGSTVGATVDVAPSCGPSITAPGVWYTLDDNSGLPGEITLSLCNGTDYDSKLTVYSGTCAALVCVVGNDDACALQSEVTFASNGNTTFYILIHGFGGATGNFTMDVTCTPTPPPNDMIVNSIDVDEIGFPYTDPAVAMPAATTENGSPQNCDITGANGVWYNFVAGGDGTANAMIVTPGGASSVTFYTAPDENSTETDLVLVPQNTNQCVPGTSASIFTLAGQAYYVFVLNTGAITDIMIDGTNLGISDNTIAGFSYYPNPTSGILNLRSVENIEQVSLYNVLGQVVVDRRINATASQVDISGLSIGTYLMKVTVNGQIGTYKVIKN